MYDVSFLKIGLFTTGFRDNFDKKSSFHAYKWQLKLSLKISASKYVKAIWFPRLVLSRFK